MTIAKHRKAAVLAAALAASSSAWAVGDLDPNLLANAQASFESMSKDLTAALSFKQVAPAASMGLIGFDVSAEMGFTKPAGIDQWGTAIGDTSLEYLPVPRVHARKGLPLGLEVGGLYSFVPGSNIKFWGGEVKYAIIGGNLAMPALAVRGSYTKLQGVDALDFSTKGVDLSVSKGFLFFTPYAGVGKVWGTATPNGIPGLSEASVSGNKLFAGLHIGLGIFKLAGEWDKTGDATSYSVKLGLGL